MTVGFAIGTEILKNDDIRLQPSIRAASSKSFGILKNPGRNISTTNGMEVVAVDNIGAQYEFKRFSFENTKNNGVNTSDDGSIWVTKKIITKKLIPLTLNRARPYAAGTDKTSDNIIEPIAIIDEFFTVTNKFANWSL